jgi:serine protease inhibitor
MRGTGLLYSVAVLVLLPFLGLGGSLAQTAESGDAAGKVAQPPAQTEFPPDAKPSPDVARRLAAQTRLAHRLLEQLEKEPTAEDNIVVSPASVAMALSLLELGADDKLRAAIAQALGYEAAGARPVAAAGKKPPGKPAANPAPQVARAAEKPAAPAAGKPTDDLKGLLQIIIDLDREKDLKGVLTLANSIVFDPAAAPIELALRGLRETGAKVSVDKLSSPETIRAINDWVSERTNGLIPTIIELPPLNPGLIALNALYFKDKWKYPFDASATKRAPFHGINGELDVPMMNMGRHVHRVQADERFVGVELPYMHERFAIVLVTTKDKPARAGEFDKVVNWLAGDGFVPAQVEFSMPRFALNGQAELLRPLDAMGLKARRASPTALRGFSSVPQNISQITQKTYIRVDEAGTEAAAVTAVLTARSAARPEKIMIDKPFLFALRDRVSGLILMAGYVGSPTAGPVAELR